MEDLLAEGMQCTMTYPCEFEEYVTKWAHVFPMLNNFYTRYRTHHTSEYWLEGQPFHHHLHLCAYMQQQQADQCLVKSIISGHDPKPAIVIGNWSASMTRFHEPICGIGMRCMLRRHKLKVVLIDKYCTSQMCPACDSKLKKFLWVLNPRPFWVKKHPEVWCHGLLRCMSKECISWVMQNSGRKAHEPEWVADGRYWNRDTAAMLNFHCIVCSLVATCMIPKPFRHNGSRTLGSDDDTPAADNGTGSDANNNIAAQMQHWYPTRRRTGHAPTDNVQQQ
ncbi:hypothetical protein GGI23_003429 [Coemansia sp. RSA 2559]|nr:hypothetical protein GGI23_003429 [Coemansia sp. RSA 2559]KAJ2852783.1 hypothetical protein GGI22_005144 [Coemansia erecta]